MNDPTKKPTLKQVLNTTDAALGAETNLAKPVATQTPIPEEPLPVSNQDGAAMVIKSRKENEATIDALLSTGITQGFDTPRLKMHKRIKAMREDIDQAKEGIERAKASQRIRIKAKEDAQSKIADEVKKAKEVIQAEFDRRMKVFEEYIETARSDYSKQMDSNTEYFTQKTELYKKECASIEEEVRETIEGNEEAIRVYTNMIADASKGFGEVIEG